MYMSCVSSDTSLWRDTVGIQWGYSGGTVRVQLGYSEGTVGVQRGYSGDTGPPKKLLFPFLRRLFTKFGFVWPSGFGEDV